MNAQQTNSDALLSDIRRLQEKLYSKEEDYTYKIPVEHQETWEKIEDLVEVKRRYDEIMSAETSKAMEVLKLLGSQWIYFHENHIDTDDMMELKELNPDWWEEIEFALLRAHADHAKAVKYDEIMAVDEDDMRNSYDKILQLLIVKTEESDWKPVIEPLRKHILKSISVQKELAKLKRKVIEIANEVDKKQVNWLSVAVCFQELRELCEVKE